MDNSIGSLAELITGAAAANKISNSESPELSGEESSDLELSGEELADLSEDDTDLSEDEDPDLSGEEIAELSGGEEPDLAGEDLRNNFEAKEPSENPTNKGKLSKESEVQSPKKSRNATDAEWTVTVNEKVGQKHEDSELEARTIFVRNLPTYLSRLKLNQLFSKFGVVETIKCAAFKTPKKNAFIAKQFYPVKKRFFAFIRFEERDSAVKAVEANGMVYNDHHLSICLYEKEERREKHDGSKAIIVKNLDYRAEDEDLWKTFESCGPITSVHIVRDARTGIAKGYGYVNFKNSDSATLALEMEYVKIKNREVVIDTHSAANKKETVKKDLPGEEIAHLSGDEEPDLASEDSHNNSETKEASKIQIKKRKLTEESEVQPPKKSKNATTAEEKVANKQKDPELNARTVFVGNLPISSNINKLKKLFSKFGVVDDVSIIGAPVADPKTHKKNAFITNQFRLFRNHPFAFIRFEERDGALKAVEANGMVYNDHHLRIRLRDSQEKPDKSKAIFVGNLPFGTEEEDLWKTFESCGPITSVHIVRDAVTGIWKGFGYVNFENSDSVTLALEMENVKIKNREVLITNDGPSKNQTGKKDLSGEEIAHLSGDEDPDLVGEDSGNDSEAKKPPKIQTNKDKLSEESEVQSPKKSKNATDAEWTVTVNEKVGQKREEDPELDARYVFVENLPISSNTLKLKKLFSKFGVVEDVCIKEVRVPGPKTPKKVPFFVKQFRPFRNRYYALIRFEERDGAVKAVEANGMVYNDRHLRIRFRYGQKKHDSNKSIFVGNLDFRAEDEDLWKTFESCGPITSVYIARNAQTGLSRGFGFVQFENSDSVTLSLEIETVRIQGREVKISACNVNEVDKNKMEKKDLSDEEIADLSEEDPDFSGEGIADLSGAEDTLDLSGEDSGNDCEAEETPKIQTNKRKLTEESEVQSLKKSKNDTKAETRETTEENTAQNHEEDLDFTGRTVFVGNLPITFNSLELKKLFSKFGVVDAVWVREAALKTPEKVGFITKRFHPFRKRFFAFIRFEERDGAVKAVEANSMVYNDRHLSIRLYEIEKPRDKRDDSKAIFVGDLDHRAEDEDLWKTFESCGPIKSVRILRDARTGIAKGCGYVNFENSDSVTLALEMENVKIRNREVVIKFCAARKKKTEKKDLSGEEIADVSRDEEPDLAGEDRLDLSNAESQNKNNFVSKNWQNGTTKPGEGGPRKPWKVGPRKPMGGGPKKPWEGGPRKPWQSRPKKPWEGGPRKPWEGRSPKTWNTKFSRRTSPTRVCS